MMDWHIGHREVCILRSRCESAEVNSMHDALDAWNDVRGAPCCGTSRPWRPDMGADSCDSHAFVLYLENAHSDMLRTPEQPVALDSCLAERAYD
jgi:hypothetical protein